MSIRLLITARDVSAALPLVQVARAGLGDCRFEIVVAAQEPAAAYFSAAGLDVRLFPGGAATSPDGPEAIRLRTAARALLHEIRPDAVLAGLSTPFDAGLDEAVLVEARVPTTLFQDFWGEQNLMLGHGADKILVIDSQATERNLARFGKPSVVVGSPRHAAYAQLDVRSARQHMRAAAGIATSEQVVGFFGQALHALPGYTRTIRQFVSSVRTLGPNVIVTLRPHPRESVAQRQQSEAIFHDAGLRPLLLPASTVEDALAACDVVVSLFSICTFDTAYLNRFAPEPVAVPMSLLFDDEIAAYCQQHGNYFDFSHHTLGLVKPVYDAAALEPALRAALLPATRREVWDQARAHLPDPTMAPARVLDAIEASVRSPGGRQ